MTLIHLPVRYRSRRESTRVPISRRQSTINSKSVYRVSDLYGCCQQADITVVWILPFCWFFFAISLNCFRLLYFVFYSTPTWPSTKRTMLFLLVNGQTRVLCTLPFFRALNEFQWSLREPSRRICIYRTNKTIKAASGRKKNIFH